MNRRNESRSPSTPTARSVNSGHSQASVELDDIDRCLKASLIPRSVGTITCNPCVHHGLPAKLPPKLPSRTHVLAAPPSLFGMPNSEESDVAHASNQSTKLQARPMRGRRRKRDACEHSPSERTDQVLTYTARAPPTSLEVLSKSDCIARALGHLQHRKVRELCKLPRRPALPSTLTRAA